jgi:hypothetical protein
MKAIVALLATALAVTLAEDCANELAGMKGCMMKNFEAKRDAFKAAVQKCFTDLNCPLPELPNHDDDDDSGDGDRAIFMQCHEQVEAIVKPKLEECVQANPLLANFVLPDRPDRDHGDKDKDPLDFFLMMLMKRRGGRKSRSGDSSEEEDDKSGGHAFESCQGLKECLKAAHDSSSASTEDDDQDESNSGEQMKLQCFDELGVSEACQALDIKAILCQCGKQVGEESADEAAEAMAACLKENGQEVDDIEKLKKKAASMCGRMCGGGHGKRGGRSGGSRSGGSDDSSSAGQDGADSSGDTHGDGESSSAQEDRESSSAQEEA